MKIVTKFFGLLTLCVAASMSCTRELDLPERALPEEAEGTVPVAFECTFADYGQTKTVFSGDGSVIEWDSTEKLRVRQVCYAGTESNNKAYSQLRISNAPVLRSDNTYYVQAYFDAVPNVQQYKGKSKGIRYMYQAFYPAGAAQKTGTDVLYTLPDSQTPVANSFDPAADLVISDQVFSKSQRTDGLTVNGLTFSRLSSIGVLTLKGLGSGVDVSAVEISSGDNQPLAGTYTVGMDNSRTLTTKKYKISLNLSKCKPSNSNNFKVYFTCLPGTYKNVKVSVTTSKGTYSRTVGQMVFAKGQATLVPAITIRTEKTLMSYNVGIFFKSETYKYDEIAQLLVDQQATYVALNEVDSVTTRTGKVDQLYKLKSLMESKAGHGYWYHFGAALKPYKGGAYGNGVISGERVEKDANNKYKYYHFQLTNKKNGSVVQFTTASGEAKKEEVRSVSILETADCIFAAAHLGLTADMRKIQVSQLNQWFSTHFAATTKPVFLCGDFNAEPTEVQELMSSKWTMLSDPSQNTHSTKKANPVHCIDYILCWKNASAPEVKVNSRKVLYASDVPDIKTYSDHYPVKVKVEW